MFSLLITAYIFVILIVFFFIYLFSGYYSLFELENEEIFEYEDSPILDVDVMDMMTDEDKVENEIDIENDFDHDVTNDDNSFLLQVGEMLIKEDCKVLLDSVSEIAGRKEEPGMQAEGDCVYTAMMMDIDDTDEEEESSTGLDNVIFDNATNILDSVLFQVDEMLVEEDCKAVLDEMLLTICESTDVHLDSEEVTEKEKVDCGYKDDLDSTNTDKTEWKEDDKPISTAAENVLMPSSDFLQDMTRQEVVQEQFHQDAEQAGGFDWKKWAEEYDSDAEENPSLPTFKVLKKSTRRRRLKEFFMKYCCCCCVRSKK